MTHLEKDKESLKLYINDKSNVYMMLRDYIDPFYVPNYYVKDILKDLPDIIHTESISRIRTLGDGSQSDFLLELYSTCKDLDVELELMTPYVKTLHNNDPIITMLSMRSWSYPSSVGGYHKMSTKDVAQYLVRHAVDSEMLEHSDRLLDRHPIGKALRFIGHLDIPKVLKVLARVVDPRWFINPLRPGSFSSLKRYLGLVPAKSRKNKEEAYTEVISSWKHTERPPRETDHPSYFLWQYWEEVQGDNERKDLRTCQFFLSYIVYNWLNVLYPDTPDDLFAADIFFKKDLHVEYYKKHMKS